MDIQRLLAESAQPQSEGDIVFIAGLTKREVVDCTYTDGQPSYRIDYNVKLFLYDKAQLVGSFTLEGYPPPFVKSGSGPAYGDPPAENVAGWLAEQTNARVRSALGAHSKPVTSLAFSPDGRILASAGRELEVKLWDVTSQKLVSIIQACYFGHGINSIAFSPDGSALATAGWLCGGVSLWDVANGQNIATLTDDVSPSFVAFSPDGRLLAWEEYEDNGNDQIVVLWDTLTKCRMYTFHMGESTPHCAAFSPDGALLAVGDWDNYVTLWNVTSGNKLAYFEHDDWVNDVVFSPDGGRLASGSKDGSLRLWDISSGEMISKTSVSREITSIAWSPGGKAIAFAGEDCLIRLWNVASGELVEWPVTAPRLRIDITPSVASGHAPLEVHFTAISFGHVERWEWDFGDGSSSEERSPTHVYQTGGEYTATLRATNVQGQTAKKTTVIKITGDLSIFYDKQSPYSKTLGGERIHLVNNRDAMPLTRHGSN